MLFATVACIIVKRHRRRVAQREAMAVGTGHVDSQGEGGGSSQTTDILSGRTERDYVTLPRAFPSLGSPVREPPPACVRGVGLPRGDSEVLQWVGGFEASAEEPIWNALC